MVRRLSRHNTSFMYCRTHRGAVSRHNTSYMSVLQSKKEWTGRTQLWATSCEDSSQATNSYISYGRSLVKPCKARNRTIFSLRNAKVYHEMGCFSTDTPALSLVFFSTPHKAVYDIPREMFQSPPQRDNVLHPSTCHHHWNHRAHLHATQSQIRPVLR
jgi:hypothetical protein